MKRIGVLGAGTMGHGIAQVCAMAGYDVRITDNDPAGLQRGLDNIQKNLNKGVVRGKVTEEAAAAAMANVSGAASLQAAADGADLVIEAVPEILSLKQSLFDTVAAHAPEHCIFGTNTSSLSVASIASQLDDPGRVIGTHFFNPVHIMKLLEVIVSEHTRADVVEQIESFGAQIGKDVII
ncbi:MAG: 3-hydroxybutyryl-CoA dehydrogenase, partial [Kiritimatiellia bacterium]